MGLCQRLINYWLRGVVCSSTHSVNQNESYLHILDHTHGTQYFHIEWITRHLDIDVSLVQFLDLILLVLYEDLNDKLN